MLPVETPFKVYTDLNGQPLQNGYVYFGQPNQNPITAPVTVYWDAAGTQPAAQPLRTTNGYIMRAGTPANVFINSSYSELVQNSTKAQVFFARNSDEFSTVSAVDAFKTALAGASGASQVGVSSGATLQQQLDMMYFGVRNIRDTKYNGGAKQDGVGVYDAATGMLIGANGTDDYSAIQAAIDDAAAAGGGFVLVPASPTFTICNTTLRLPSGVSLIGTTREACRIVKNSTTTKNFNIVASPLVPGIYPPGTLPSAINGILVLDGTNGRYSGRVSGISFFSTYAIAGNYESQKAEFGIVSVGSVSDAVIEDNYVNFCGYGIILPDIFASRMLNNRVTQCLGGISISGTSCPYMGNYTNGCRDYGHYFRALSYTPVHGNACDSLNRSDFYPDRTRLCAAYTFDACTGLDIVANGQETTLGRNWVLRGLRHSAMKYNFTTNLGSDYSGTQQIAWLYSTEINQGNEITDNFSYDYNSNGMLFGGATSRASQHHNIYFEGLANVEFDQFEGNVVRASLSGSVVEAGYGNNVPTAWINAAKGGEMVYSFSPTLSAATPGNLVMNYGPGNKHFTHKFGGLVHVWGCFDVTPTYTTASSYLTIAGLPTNHTGALWKVLVTGVDYNGALLTKKLGSFRVNDGSDGGIAFDDGDGDFFITDIPSGTRVAIFYDGWYLS